MPSPFPGMDPYLEQTDVWPDFHGTFLVSLRAEINKVLPKHTVARWDRHGACSKPFLKIVDTRGHPVVTVLELLSPANKTPGRDRDAYLAKREEYLRARVNLVEMDLLRAGMRPPVEQPRPPADYYLLVCPAADYPDAGIWPLTVRDELPALPIPLHAEDDAVIVPLRPSLDRAYDEARLGEEIDCDQPPVPPFSEADAAWAKDFLAEHQA